MAGWHIALCILFMPCHPLVVSISSFFPWCQSVPCHFIVLQVRVCPALSSTDLLKLGEMYLPKTWGRGKSHGRKVRPKCSLDALTSAVPDTRYLRAI